MPQAATKAAPQTPVLTGTPSAIVPGRVGAPAIPIPLTQADVQSLLDRRSELSTELGSADGRRHALANDLRRARVGPDQAGIEARISQLDNRIITIESDMADIGKAISAAPNGLVQNTSTAIPHRWGEPSAGQVTGIAIVFTIAVLMPLSIAFARGMLRRSSRPPASGIPKDVADRLERMEQGIETVALEVERIGEGQRFVTQLMGERAKQSAIPEHIPRT